ncbi:MAG: GNAT family N-acetyltransferase [Chitinophagales bacterium]
MQINYNNKQFCPIVNAENGETSSETIFLYRQSGDILTASYNGGKIKTGHLLGKVDEFGNIEMRYHQVNTAGELMTGFCHSKPEILADGRLRLHETWQWTSGDGSKGKSILEEIKVEEESSENLILENERVRLEPLQRSHLEKLLPIALKYPNLLQYSPSPFGTKTALRQYIEIALAAKKNKIRIPFAIFDKQKNEYAGSTSFGNISPKDKRLEIGWTWLNERFQGTGLNKNCKFLMLRYAFEQFEAERVEFRADSRNAKSRRAMEKLGAKYEGELRSHTLMNDGYRRDTVYYSILKAEWETLKIGVFQEFLK